MKKFLNISLYTILFLGSFVFFLIFTFPYEVLKEAISAEVSKATGLSVRIGDMGPALPVGVTFEKLEVGNPGGKAVKLDEVSLSIPMLALLLGDVGANVYIENRKGYLDVGASLGIISLVTGNFMRQKVVLESKAFRIDEIVGFAFEKLGEMFPLARSDLQKIVLQGSLNSDIEMKLDDQELSNSQVDVKVQLTRAVLKSIDPSFDLPQQKFTKALVRASANRGVINIDKKSGFTSKDLKIGFDGEIKILNPIGRSQVDFKIPLEMKGGLKTMLGGLIEAFVLKGQLWQSGEITFLLNGTFNNIRFDKKF